MIGTGGGDRQGGSKGRAQDRELEAADGSGARVVGDHDLKVKGAQICRARGAREAPADRIKIQPAGQGATANKPGGIEDLITWINFAKCVARDDEIVGSRIECLLVRQGCSQSRRRIGIGGVIENCVYRAGAIRNVIKEMKFVFVGGPAALREGAIGDPIIVGINRAAILALD